MKRTGEGERGSISVGEGRRGEPFGRVEWSSSRSRLHQEGSAARQPKEEVEEAKGTVCC